MSIWLSTIFIYWSIYKQMTYFILFIDVPQLNFKKTWKTNISHGPEYSDPLLSI